VLLDEAADGLHPPVQHDVLAGPDIVRHELDLLRGLLFSREQLRRLLERISTCQSVKRKIS
jgi:hypothetical protein